ncbi:MAG: hypothetical protein H6698_08965 [Myxococcales bacterium]|nr:hypothetical protein [Myxococcales bacterium]MCB9531697.1 hypothetical protein [Myxococcales bacterium]MCB9534416.1 hypothetical protein [Myxococcales bacterium]
MKSMAEVVSENPQRAAVVRDVVTLIDTEVDRKGGLSGMGIKAAYKVVKSVKASIIPEVVDGLLDEFCAAIEPLHATYRANPSGSFANYLTANRKAAVDALLATTDGRARRTSNATLKKTYEKLRPIAEGNVAEALPGLGRLIDKHCA